MKILYIEDNPVDIDLTLRRMKRDCPHITINVVKSQAEALNEIKKPGFSSYDLVLTDMHLQDGDGIAVLSHIRGHSLPVAVIILTGQGDEEAAVAALKAGADDYLVKKKGYLDGLCDLLGNALISYQKKKDLGIQVLKILYIEHNPADIDLTQRHLNQYAPHIKMEVISRVSDFYAVVDQTAALSSYSAMLLDYRLPQENALEILKRIKLSPNSAIPVILVTGKGDEEIAVKALKLGAFDYLVKNQGYLFKLPSVIENAYYNRRLIREHQALTESESRYRSLFENNHVVMLLINPETGDIIDANSAASRFYGWSKQELKHKNIYEINTLPPEALNREIHTALDGRRSYFVFRHQRSDGSICDVEVYSGPIEVGGRTLVYSMIYDITERLKSQKEKELLQKQLLQSHKMESFGQLAGGIAHDFNNILSSIIGFTELALGQVAKGAPIEDDLQEVYAAGKRAKDLVKQILAFARQSDEEIKPIQITAIVNEVLRLIKASTPANIEIRMDGGSESHIMGNAIQIHQVIMNLCTNAVHAMENDGGILTVGVTDVENPLDLSQLNLKPGRYVRLVVSDTGSGIPEPIIDSIFEPYFTTKVVGEGTGMGLAMVHGIVENYGGKISVASKKDAGSIFKIYLPVIQGGLPNQPCHTEEHPTGTERILFVDDEVPIAKMGDRLLSKLGYCVKAMTSSVEALELFKSSPFEFDLVVSDVTMPNMTGDKLAVEFMKIRPDIPVILCSGYNKKISDESLLMMGVKAFAFKPIVKADLARTIRTVLDNARNKV